MEEKTKVDGTCSINNTKDLVPQEPTKEQLLGILHQVSEQDKKLFDENKKLKNIIEDMNMTNFFKRLDYLFKIISEDNSYLTLEFKEKCARELESLMTQEDQEVTGK